MRAPALSMNALVLHAPVEGSDAATSWWEESLRVAQVLPQHAKTLYLLMQMAELDSDAGALLVMFNLMKRHLMVISFIPG